MYQRQTTQSVIIGLTLVLLAIAGSFLAIASHNLVQAAEDSGSVGLEGRINAAPPTTGATITFPANNATITNLPVNVTGLCPGDLLVKIFKNNVFAGATQCKNGSFSVQIDLFSGRNELVARVYDNLDQPGPDSNVVVVTLPFNGINPPNRLSLTSSFAKRGANPKQTLTWPITLTGGTGPYAITVDWGDGKQADIISQAFPGTFNISHIYDNPGVYNVVVRATDKDGNLAFLQLVGVANGPVGQNNASGDGQGAGQGNKGGGTNTTQTKILWQPAAIAVPLIVSSFWLGKHHQVHILRKRLERNEDVS